MSDPFLGIGGVNYATEEAKALQINERGELATENVLKRELILQEESLSPETPFTHTIAAADIPKGAGYIGIFIASTSTTSEFSLTYDVSRNNSFGANARYMQQTYNFKKPRTNHVVREVGNLDGSSIRIQLDTEASTIYSIWIVYYRNATPTTSELKPEPRQEVVRTWDVTVAAGQTGTTAQAPNMTDYRYYYYAITVNSHNWTLRNGTNVPPSTGIIHGFTILPAGFRGNTVTDMYDVVASHMQPRITNNSNIEQTYTVALVGVK